MIWLDRLGNDIQPVSELLRNNYTKFYASLHISSSNNESTNTKITHISQQNINLNITRSSKISTNTLPKMHCLSLNLFVSIKMNGLLMTISVCIRAPHFVLLSTYIKQIRVSFTIYNTRTVEPIFMFFIFLKFVFACNMIISIEILYSWITTVNVTQVFEITNPCASSKICMFVMRADDIHEGWPGIASYLQD